MLSQLLHHIYDYLITRYTLREVEAWLLSNLQNILDSSDERAIEVANNVDADLVELGEGLIDETMLRERFEKYIRAFETIVLHFPETTQPITAHATATVATLRDELNPPELVEDQHLGRVYV